MDVFSVTHGVPARWRFITTLATVGLFIIAAVSGCHSVISVYPLYDSADKNVIKDPRIVGSWKWNEGQNGDPVTVVVSESKESHYDVTCTGVMRSDRLINRKVETVAKTVSKRYDLRLVKVGATHFLDIAPRRVLGPETAAEYEPLLITGHYIVECTFRGKSLLLRQISPQRIRELAKQKGSKLTFVESTGNLVLTIKTEELQRLLREDARLVLDERVILLKRLE